MPFNLNTLTKSWLYFGAPSVSYALCLCLAGTLHLVSNENKVRGLWSVIIFIWETVGACSTFVLAIRDSSLSTSDSNEHQALIMCWGWHLWKKRLKINVTFHCPHMTRGREKKKSSHTCHKLTWESALWKYCLLEKCWWAKRKDRSKEGETVTGVGKNLMIHTPACCQHTRSVWFYLDQHYTCTHLYSQTHTTTTRWDRSTKQPLGNFVPCRFTYF